MKVLGPIIFCKLPFQDGETTLRISTTENTILILTTLNRVFMIDKQGRIQEVIDLPIYSDNQYNLSADKP